MTSDEFRQAYFDQYAEDGDVCDDAWFQRYFESSGDWLELEYQAQQEGFAVYSDPESDIGGYWATSAAGGLEGPFETMAEVAVALGYSPRNFPPDADADAEEDDYDDLDDELDPDDNEEEPEFDEEDEDFGEDFDEDED